MPSKPCKKSGCPNLVRDNSGYCKDHQSLKQERKATATKKKTAKFYGLAVWQRARAWKRKKDPLCEMCFEKGIVKAAQMVDHVDEIEDGGAKLDSRNLMSLCYDCHNKKTAKNKG